MNVHKKKDLLMDAIGSIDPKYIEEARQAITPDSGKKSPFPGFFSRPAHFRAVRLAAAACLILLVLAGASQTGILKDLIVFHPDKMNDSSVKILSQESQDKYPDAENNPGESGSPQTAESRSGAMESLPEDAAIEKAENAVPEKNTDNEYDSSYILSEPPSLNLYVWSHAEDFRHNTTEETEVKSSNPEACVSVPRNTYDWTYDTGDNQKTSSIACGSSDIWNSSDLPVIELKAESIIEPDFNGNPPDSLTISCLPASKSASGDPEPYLMEISAGEDGCFILPTEESTYIVKITANWNSDRYSGSCTYGFRAEYVD